MVLVQRQLGVSERRACRVLGQARSTQRRRPKVKEDEEALREDEVMLGGIGEMAADDMTSIGPDWLMLPMQDRIR